MNTIELIDLAKEKANIPSDYRMAKIVGRTQSFFSHCRSGKRQIDEASALKMADMAGLDRDYVLASLAAEKEKDEAVKTQWLHLAERLQPSRAAAVILSVMVGVGALLFPFGNNALASNSTDRNCTNSIYYVKSRKQSRTPLRLALTLWLARLLGADLRAAQ